MTTKILTIRLPAGLYGTLCTDAAERGVSVSAHIKRLIEREHQSEQLTDLRSELLTRLDSLAAPRTKQAATGDEVLLLCRAVAAHLSPQLVSQVHAKLAQKS